MIPKALGSVSRPHNNQCVCVYVYVCVCTHTHPRASLHAHVCRGQCLWGGRYPRPDPLGHPEQEGATSSFQAVIEEAGVPLGWEGVEGKVLGLGRGELHVGPVLIRVVLERLVSPVQGADVRLG